MGKEQGVTCLIVSVISLIITICILLGLTWRRVYALKYGLKYNAASKQIEKDKIYMPGIYTVGPGTSFIEYPAHQNAVIFKTLNPSTGDTQAFPINAFRMDSIKALTKDGIEIKCDLVANYKLTTSDDITQKGKEIYELHMRYLGNYERAVALAYESAVLDVYSTFTAQDVYLDRKRLTIEVNAKASEKLKPILCSNTMVNIVNMDLPQTYMDAIVQTQIAIQKIKETQYLQEGEVIQAQTNINVAGVNKNLAINKAKSEGEVYKKVKQAEGEALTIRLDNIKTAYEVLRTSGLTYTAVKDKLFVHYMMALKLGTGYKKVYLKNLKPVGEIVNSD